MSEPAIAERIVIFSAPSGAGKTTILHAVLNRLPYLHFSVSATTRPRRPHEVHGQDYYFMTVDEFFDHVKQGDFVEWQEVYPGRFYGTLKSEVKRQAGQGRVVVFEVDVLGGINLKRYYDDAALALFIQPPSVSSLEARLLHRATESEAEIARRLRKAEFEMQFAVHYDCVIVNDELDRAINEAAEAIAQFVQPTPAT